MEKLGRSSLEAYGFGLIAIIALVFPVNTTFRIILSAIGIGLILDIICRSPWTIAWCSRHKFLASGFVVVIAGAGLWFLLRQPAESKPTVAQVVNPVVVPDVAPAPGPKELPIIEKPKTPRREIRESTVKVTTAPPVPAPPVVSSQTGPAIGTITQTQAPCSGGIAIGGGTANGGNCGPPEPKLRFVEDALPDSDGAKHIMAHIYTDRAIPGAIIGVFFSGPAQMDGTPELKRGGIQQLSWTPVTHLGVPIPHTVAITVNAPAAFLPGQDLAIPIKSTGEIHILSVAVVGN